jgi:hypothetical protein
LFGILFAKSLAGAFRADAIRAHEAGPNLMTVHHGKLDTPDFKASKDTVRRALLIAEVRFYEELRLKNVGGNDRAMHRIFNSVQEAVESFSVRELETFKNVPLPPEPVDLRPNDVMAFLKERGSLDEFKEFAEKRLANQKQA